MTGGAANDPTVRIVIVNFNGGDLVLECLRRVAALDWPKSRLDVIVVDNGSSDGSAERVETAYPAARVLRLSRNLGYAGGNNAGIRDPRPYDYVALLNNDAFVTEAWLRPLVSAVQSDERIGAASSKVLLAPSFIELVVDGGGADLRLGAVRAAGADAFETTRFVRGFGVDGGVRRGPGGTLWVPVPRSAQEPLAVGVMVSASGGADVSICAAGATATRRVGRAPVWIELEARPDAVFDVLNNAGNVLYEDGYAADRGLGERDAGQLDAPEEVFAWCGCSTLLSKAYLADVGLFDDRLFAYYEDIDLAWRGRARGWRYLYVPESVVYHVHTATSRQGSSFFEHFVERNRLIVLVRNAPTSFAGRAVYRYLRMLGGLLVRDVMAPLSRGRRPDMSRLGRRTRSFLDFARRLPATMRDRIRTRARQTVADAELIRWTLPH
jgi:GT2 family glycosyltransferase